MLPMSVRCSTCGTFMYKGTKFNTRKEDAVGEDYLGIQVFRFYYRCPHCAAEFCMKTDPKTSDYIMEKGAAAGANPKGRGARVLQTGAARHKRAVQGRHLVTPTVCVTLLSEFGYAVTSCWAAAFCGAIYTSSVVETVTTQPARLNLCRCAVPQAPPETTSPGETRTRTRRRR